MTKLSKSFFGTEISSAHIKFIFVENYVQNIKKDKYIYNLVEQSVQQDNWYILIILILL